MTSSIDTSKPEEGQATTESVRDNFQFAKDEIEAIQAVDAGQDTAIGDNASAIGVIQGEQTTQDTAIGQNATDIGTLAGEIAGKVDRSGDAMTGDLDGVTPTAAANLTRKDYVDSEIISAIGGVSGALTGSVLMWAIDTEPTGYKLCNGQAIDRTAFNSLFTLLGITYGNGNGSTTFNLPDYRGQFLRGRDAGRGLDPDAAGRTDRGDGTGADNVGSTQGDNNLSHAHAAAGDHGHASAGSHQHASSGDHGHAAAPNHTHAAAGDHGHAANGSHQHASAGNHFHELNRFESGSAIGVSYVQTDNDDSETPSTLDTKMSTAGAHQHASTGSHTHANAGDHSHAAAGGHTHANAGAHTHAATGDHTHANAGSHSHAASGGSEARPVNIYVNFIIKT